MVPAQCAVVREVQGYVMGMAGCILCGGMGACAYHVHTKSNTTPCPPPPSGASAYSRDWDYKRFRQIADKVNALLMVDMAHIR